MPDLASVIVSAVVSFGLALAVLGVSYRSGFTDVQQRLVMALKDRVSLLEAENARKDLAIERLEAEVAALERRYARLEQDHERLLARLEHIDA